MGKLTISMVIFNSYVSLPEDTLSYTNTAMVQTVQMIVSF